MGPGLAELADELATRAREQGVVLTGPGGLLSALTKQVLETALRRQLRRYRSGRAHAEVARPWRRRLVLDGAIGVSDIVMLNDATHDPTSCLGSTVSLQFTAS